MSKNGKIDYPDGNDDQKDIRWFENYEKRSKAKHLERLKNEDILNYIKDVEQNCRLEVSSDDEDYAGTKRSSNCSVKRSDTRFSSLKEIKSRVASKKNKNTVSKRKTKQSSGHNTTDACNHCCSGRKFPSRGGPDFTVEENSRRNINTSTKSIYRHSNLSGNSYKYRESSPVFHGWYSRKNHNTWPATTETASYEVIRDAIPDRSSRISRSKLMDTKSTNKVRALKSLRRRAFEDIYSSIAPNEKTTKRDPDYRDYKQRRETRMRKLYEESDVSDFVNQQPLNEIYSDRNMTFSYQTPVKNERYKGRYTSGYHYPIKRSRQPTSWGLTSRSNRLTASTRLSETSSLLQRRASQWENKVGRPLKASGSIIGTSIDRSYREAKRKNNTDQWRRRPDVLRKRESSCYRRPGLLRESGKLCKVVRTREDKQRLGCCCEDAEQDETAECSRYCRCPENTNGPIRPRRENTRRPFTTSERANYAVTTVRNTLPESVQPGDNDEGESESDLPIEEDPRNVGAVCDNHSCDIFDDERTNNRGDAVDLEDLKPRVSFPKDRARRGSREVARRYKKFNNDLKSNEGKAMGARTALGKKITPRYPASKKFAIRTPGKLVSGDSLGLRYDAAGSVCECREPFHDPPAVCLTRSCTCIGNDENAERNDSDSSRRIFDTVYCCDCCSCSSSVSYEEKDPVKKLESFCEKVKAVNQDTFRRPSKSTCRNAVKTNAQEYGGSYEQNQSMFSTQRAIRRARPIEKERLANSARLRLEKPKHSDGKANLEKILIYPPRGEGGPPLTLYKRSSNINCRVKGNADTGFRYSVTYMQKFVSPTWMPSMSPKVLSRETDVECSCPADYG